MAQTADSGITQICSFCAGPQGAQFSREGGSENIGKISSLVGVACGGLPFSQMGLSVETWVYKGLPGHLTPASLQEACFVCEYILFSNWRRLQWQSPDITSLHFKN